MQQLNSLPLAPVVVLGCVVFLVLSRVRFVAAASALAIISAVGSTVWALTRPVATDRATSSSAVWSNTLAAVYPRHISVRDPSATYRDDEEGNETHEWEYGGHAFFRAGTLSAVTGCSDCNTSEIFRIVLSGWSSVLDMVTLAHSPPGPDAEVQPYSEETAAGITALVHSDDALTARHEAAGPAAGLTVGEAVSAAAAEPRLSGGPRSWAAGSRSSSPLAALRAMRLADEADTRVAQLSLLQRKRLSIAAALVTDSAILLLEDPAGGLTAA